MIKYPISGFFANLCCAVSLILAPQASAYEAQGSIYATIHADHPVQEDAGVTPQGPTLPDDEDGRVDMELGEHIELTFNVIRAVACVFVVATILAGFAAGQ